MHHLLDPNRRVLEEWFSERGEPGYRVRQVEKWLFNEGRVHEPQEMTDLPARLRDQLAQDFQVWTSRLLRHDHAKDGTEKLLLELSAGGRIECVLLRDQSRKTICISSQVGCAMGCVFCASGLEGLERNLSGGEIVEQMLLLRRLLSADERITHIVVMGIGEPLANLDALLPALDVANDPGGLGISNRRITISTVGLPEAIRRLSRRQPHYHLAVSLHAPNDELRNRLVPVNGKIGIRKIVRAADEYFEVSGRRLTFEYVLLAGINDQPAHANRLAELLKGRPALLNIIPYNPVVGLPYRTPSTNALACFRRILEAAGLNVRVRQRKGEKISAACGQLRLTGQDSD